MNKREKQRDELINDAKKKKKKLNDDEIPYVPTIVDLGNGTFARIRNMQMKILNLSLNPFLDSDY